MTQPNSFRNQPDEARWTTKQVCLALGCVFVYALSVNAEAVMFGRFAWKKAPALSTLSEVSPSPMPNGKPPL